MSPRLSFPSPRRCLAAVWLLCALAAWTTPVRAEEAPPLPTLRNLGEYYGASTDTPNARYAYVFDLDVQFLDLNWRLMWVTNGDTYTFVIPGPNLNHLRSGMRIRAEGETIATGKFSLDGARITILRENAPIPPLEPKGRIGQAEFFTSRNVRIEALVERQHEPDSTHTVIETVCEGRRVIGRILIDPAEPVPQFSDRWVEMTGVYVMDEGRVADAVINVWVPSTKGVKTLRTLAEDPAFNLPETRLDQLVGTEPNQLIRIEGNVLTAEPGRSGVAIRSAFGQISAISPQTRFTQPGTLVEAIGYPKLEGARWRLERAILRPSRSPNAPVVELENGLPRLRVAAQVLDLRPNDAARGYPVHLTGVITWADSANRRMFVEDSSRGIEVRLPADLAEIPPVPFGVSVVGRTAMGTYAPIIEATKIDKTVPTTFPDPRRVDLDQLLSGNEQGRWIEVAGFVHAVDRTGGRSRLSLTTPTGEFDAWVAAGDLPANLEQAVVRVHGVCAALTNSNRQLRGIELLVPDAAQIDLVEPAPTAIFEVPEISISALRQFGPVQSLHSRVRTRGAVTFHETGQQLFLQDGTEVVQVLSREKTPIKSGDLVEVVGFPGRDGPRLVLREASYRRTAEGEPVSPLQLKTLHPLQEAADGRLIQVHGRLTNLSRRETGTVLTFQNAERTYEALLAGESAGGADPAIGSLLELTGVYHIKFDEFRHPKDAELLLRSTLDWRVLEAPPWWTAERALGIAGVFGAIALAIGVWVVALRRQVARQTNLLRQQMEKQAMLEAGLERAARLQSLGVLAGGIAHDFNNLLTVVMGNLTLAMLDDKVAALAGQELREAERGAVRARDLTQQLLTFAKGGDPLREVVGLPEIVREATGFALHGSRCKAEFSFEDHPCLAHADRGQIARLVHNLVTQANRAMPDGGVIRLGLSNAEIPADSGRPLTAGRYVKFTVKDHGRGFSAEELPRIFDPYYSSKSIGGLELATVYSIANKHGGHIEVESTPSLGTQFTLWIPAADAPAPVVAAAPKPAARPTPPVAAKTAAIPPGGPVAAAQAPTPPRVLVLDDEDGIRLLVGSVLRRQGYEVVEVADGRLCVEEFRSAREKGRPYDVLVMDLTIPGGMGGQEAIAEIRRIDTAVPAIVSSGYAQDPVIANFREYGFTALVKKPYDIRVLRETVRQLATQPQT